VVSPLIALMKDQIDALAARGIAAQRLDSTLGADDYRAAMDKARNGELRLLYVAPERFNNERFRQVLGQLRVSLFAVDEAHCISEWGHDFRPDYLKLAAFARAANAERVLALTATATPRVLDDICSGFEIDADCAVRTDFYRSNLTLLSSPASAAQRDGLLLDRLRQRPPGPTIVYTTLQRSAEQLADRLEQAGFPAQAYHAGMDTPKRTEVQDRFIRSVDGIVVATIAALDYLGEKDCTTCRLPTCLNERLNDARARFNHFPWLCCCLACRGALNKPARANIRPSSQPMTPPPMISSESGNRSSYLALRRPATTCCLCRTRPLVLVPFSLAQHSDTSQAPSLRPASSRRCFRPIAQTVGSVLQYGLYRMHRRGRCENANQRSSKSGRCRRGDHTLL